MNKKIVTIIMAVLFSVVLWGSITLSGLYYTTIKVPVKLTGVPKGYGVGYKTLKETNLRIKGDGWKLISLSLGNNENYEVIAGEEGDLKFVRLSNFLADNPWLSSGLQVFDVSPDTMSFRLERLREKSVLIKPDIAIQLREEYGVASPVKVIPESVKVYGPRSIIQKIQYVSTIRMEYKDVADAVSDVLELKSPDNISLDKKQCEIRFDVQKIVDRSFDNLQVDVLNVPRGQSVVLIPSRISIVVRGGINLLAKLKSDEIHPYIDYIQLISDTTGTIEPNLKVPFFSSVIDKRPGKLKYIIKKF
ncbi:MAG: YbbR-like domain-containing protein [Syntrophothermus sp.]